MAQVQLALKQTSTHLQARDDNRRVRNIMTELQTGIRLAYRARSPMSSLANL